MADDTLNLAPTVVTGHAGPSDADLLYALQLAHSKGDQQGAQAIAAQIANQAVSKPPAATPPPSDGNTSGSPPGPQGMAGVKDALLTPYDTAASLVSGAVAAPAAGLAGLGSMATHAMGLTSQDPADTVNAVQQAMTHQPSTYGGQQIVGGIGKVAGVVPKAANAAGEYVTDKTGSPLLGTAVNTAIQGAGMILGGEAPAIAGQVGRAASRIPVVKTATQLASDYLPGGANRAATRTIQQYAGSPTDAQNAAAQVAIHQAGDSGALAAKYGYQPNTAGVTQNAGLAQMERTLRQQPETAGAFNARDVDNKNATNDILHGISGSAEDRLRASTARSVNANDAYKDALENPEHFVPPPTADTPSFANEAAAKQGLTQDGTPSVNNPNEAPAGLNDIGVRLQDVLKRPAVASAMSDASRVAANFGKTLDQRNLIQQMHYAKMSLDDQIGAAQAAGKTNDYQALLDSKRALLGVMDDLSPAYAQARQSFRVQSAPLNRMQVGEALRQKYQSAMSDVGGTGTRPASFVDAVQRNGDSVAQNATDFGGATLQNTLHPADLEGLNAVTGHLGRENFGQTAGRGVGSPTAQNLASENAMNNIGSIRGATGDLGAVGLALHHPGVAAADYLVGSGVRGAAKQRLAQAAMDPTLAAKMLLQKKYRTLSQQAPLGVTAPAAVGANTLSREDQGMADGGQPVKQPPKFWDLAKTAWHELTTPDDDTPQPSLLPGQTLQNAASQIQANPHNIMAAADAQS
jgi:hypothetical protein